VQLHRWEAARAVYDVIEIVHGAVIQNQMLISNPDTIRMFTGLPAINNMVRNPRAVSIDAFSFEILKGAQWQITRMSDILANLVGKQDMSMMNTSSWLASQMDTYRNNANLLITTRGVFDKRQFANLTHLFESFLVFNKAESGDAEEDAFKTTDVVCSMQGFPDAFSSRYTAFQAMPRFMSNELNMSVILQFKVSGHDMHVGMTIEQPSDDFTLLYDCAPPQMLSSMDVQGHGNGLYEPVTKKYSGVNLNPKA